jgi:putative ABC transport system permease protein
VAAADVAQATSSVSSVEGLDRRLGSADARVTVLPGASHVAQLPDPDVGVTWSGAPHSTAASLAQIATTLGGRRPAVEVRTRQLGVRTDLGLLQVDATGIDLRSRLAGGLYRLTAGRYPAAADEVVINRALAGHGEAVGDRLTLTTGRTVTVVGTAESAEQRTQPILVGTLDLLPRGTRGPRTWLVGGGPVPWGQVLAANARGATVLSRAVIEHPPPTDQLAPQVRNGFSSGQSQIYAVLALIGVMALLEVVLLAGPAFAVGARRQSRALALIAANGGNPAQARRVVLGSAVVLGTLGALGGTVLGIGVARLLLPVLQGMQSTYFGPFQLRWSHLAGIAGFGFLSAFLAAIVPAWIASRQDVVAVLAGRRGDRAASRRSPYVGLVLLALGVVGAVLGAQRGSGEFLIAGAAVVSVFGMIFLVPVVVVAVARLGRRLPLPLRYAVRDAARHRTRTVPAVAAVAATVAGVVALSIANSSDQAQAKADYVPQYALGTGVVTDYAHHAGFPSRAAQILRQSGADPLVIDGVRPTSRSAPHASLVGATRRLPLAASDLLGADAVVADRVPPVLPDAIDPRERSAADAILARGGVVLFAQEPLTVHVATVAAQVDTRGHTRTLSRITLPAYVVDTGSAYGPAEMVLSSTAARRLSLPATPVAAMFDADLLDARALDAVQQQIRALSPHGASVYVERGYQVPGSEKVVLWILFGLGAVLMLGGTLTATFLALSDARPDLATLSAVGASPRTRRGVAAAYAVAVGLIGAVLGAAVGFIPGIAVTYPLTRNFSGVPGPSHYLDIPWLLIGALVVALPVLTAGVVGLLARSRLPVVARLD